MTLFDRIRRSPSNTDSTTIIAVAAVLCIATWGGTYFQRTLWEPDEARYACVAWETLESNHFFMLQLNGKPYPDKPPLQFWMNMAFSRLTGGVNRISTRLPSLVGGILTCIAVVRLCALWGVGEAGWLAVLVLLGMFRFHLEGIWGRTDMLLCGLETTAIWIMCTAQRNKNGRTMLLAYILVGLAVLTKGPIGWAIPVGVFAGIAYLEEGTEGLKRTHWLWGTAIATVMCGAWLAAARLEGAPWEYFKQMLTTKSFGRITADVGHARPFYYYAKTFPLELLPWTPVLAVSVVSLKGKTARILRWWIGFVFIIFSFFTCKRGLYLLPAYPAAAIAVAAWWYYHHGERDGWMKTAAVTSSTVLLAAASALLAGAWRKPEPIDSPSFLIVPALFFLVSGTASLLYLRRNGPDKRWAYGFALASLLSLSVTGISALPLMNRVKTPLTAARIVRSRIDRSEHVYLYKQQLATLPFHSRRTGREIYSRKEIERLLQEKKRILVAFRQRDWNEIKPSLPPPLLEHPFRVGNKRLVLVELKQEERASANRP